MDVRAGGVVSPLPPYVEYGALASVPGPLKCDGTTLWCFFLEAYHDKLARLLRRVFHDPTRGEIDVRPLGSHVLASFGVIDRITPMAPPFDRMGSAREPQVALWIPCARVRDGLLGPVAERFYVFVPYIWLDNPISLASGREVFGWSKSFGTPGLPDPAGSQDLTLDAFGMDYDRGEQPAMRRLLTVTPGDGEPPGGRRRFGSLEDCARHFAHELLDLGDDFIWPGLRFTATLLEDMASHRLREIFLKQFRAIEDGHRAALQQVVDTTMTVPRFSAELLGEHHVTVTQLESEPLGDELGLADQTTMLGVRIEMDFVVHTGTVLWSA